MNNCNLQKELEDLLNRHCRENESNIPDFILANYMIRSLQLFEETSNQREQWYGKHLTPGGNNS